MESNGTLTEPKELSSEQPSTEKKNTSSNNSFLENEQLIQRKQIPGTPFTMIRQTMDNDKQQYFIVMGDHRLTEPTFTEQTQIDILETDFWRIIVNVVAIVVDKTIDYKKQQP